MGSGTQGHATYLNDVVRRALGGPNHLSLHLPLPPLHLFAVLSFILFDDASKLDTIS